MRIRFRHLILIGASTVLLASGANAVEKKDDKDPNRIVCEKQEVLGSRLATRRVCMSAAEWAAKRMLDRQLIDRTQIQQKGPNGG